MTVLLSGDTITLSGTATDADAVAQFTSIAGCSAVAESGRSRLVIPYKLSIVGTLTNSSAIAFTFSRSGTPTNEVVIQAGGRWNYKEARTVNGLTDWRIMPPIIFTQTVNNGYNGQSSNLIYVNGGIIDHAKVEHQGNGGQYYNGGTVIYRDVVINAEGLALVNDNQITTQSGNPTIDIIGLEVRGASMFMKGANIVNLKAYKPKFVSRGYGGGFGEQTTLQDLDSNGATFDLSIYAGGANSLLTSNNGVKGGGVTCGPWNSPSNNGTLPNEYQCTADLVLTGINQAGAAVQFRAYHLDNNSGAPVGAGKTATNYTLSKAYNQLSTVGGVNTLSILLGAGLNDNAMVRRSATQTNDLYAFKCFSYLSSPTTSASINLAGAGVKAATVVQLKDESVSQLVKATVDAYTTIDTLDQCYDRAKSFLFDNFAGETATLLLASGTSLDAGAKNIVVDASAAVAFAYSSGTNTITIKASTLVGGTKFKALATTGSFTLLNGASVSAIYTDASGTNATGVVSGCVPGSRVVIFDMDGLRAPAWQASTAYALGAKINPVTATPDLLWFETTTAGTTAATAPVFPSVAGQTVTSGTTVFTARSIVLANALAPTGTFNYSAVHLVDKQVLAAVYYVSGLTAKMPFLQETTLKNTGFGISVSQVNNQGYADGAVDGSTVTECSINASGPVKLEINAASNTTSLQRVRNFYEYQKFLGTFRTITPTISGDAANVTIGGNMVLRNTGAATLFLTGGFIKRSDGLAVADATGGFIEMRPTQVYVGISSDGAFLGAAATTQISDLAKVHGLVVGTNLVVSATTRVAGNVNQTITDASGVVTVARV